MDRQEHIDRLVAHYESPQYRGVLADADVVAQGSNPGCGDHITIYLRVDAAETAQEIRFEGEGCIISQSAVSLLLEMVQGKSLAEIEAIDYNELIETLGREVVLTRVRCATLGLRTLHQAIQQYYQPDQPDPAA